MSLADEVAALRKEVRELRDEVTRLAQPDPDPWLHPAQRPPWALDFGIQNASPGTIPTEEHRRIIAQFALPNR